MTNINKHLDKLYVLCVLESKGWTAYRLAKETGISNATFSDIKNFRHSLKWSNLAIIQAVSGIDFMGQEHLLFAINYMYMHGESFTNKNDSKKSFENSLHLPKQKMYTLHDENKDLKYKKDK